MHHAARIASFSYLVLAASCGSSDSSYVRAPELIAPLALDDVVVAVDKAAPRAYLLDASADPLSGDPRAVALPQGPSVVVRRVGYDEALVLCAGRRADDTHAEEAASLVALRPSGEQRVYLLGSPFDRLEQSDDGRYVFLFKSKAGTAERLLDDLNEIAIVDLELTPASPSAVTLRTLHSYGDSPDSIVFSPQMMIAGQERRLVVVLSSNNVSLLDLGHLDRSETIVRLALDGAARVTPSQVVFNPAAAGLYVRGAGSNAVFVLNLGARAADEPAEAGELHNDFRPYMDQLGMGATPSDMALFGAGDSARLLVLASGTQASLVDTHTSQVTSLKLPKPATHIVRFDSAETGGRGAPHALLYAEGQSTLTLLDLEVLTGGDARGIDTLELQHPVKSVVPLLEQRRVLVLHDGESVSVIDLESQSARPLASPVALTGAVFDAQRARVWVGPGAQPYVAWLDLEQGDTHEIRLDGPIDRLLPQFAAGRLVVAQQDPLGQITVLNVDGAQPSRSDARSIRGFLLAGLLDPEE